MTISKALKKRQKKAERKAAAKRVDVPGNSQKVDSTGQDPLAAASEEEEDLDGEMALDPGFSFEFDSNGLEAQIQKSSWKFAKDSCVKKRPGLSSTTLAEKIDQSRQQLLAEGGAPEEDGSEIESLAGSEEMDSENDLKDDTGDIDSEEEKDEEIDAPDGETESLAGNELYETVQELSDDEAEKDNDIRDTLRDKKTAEFFAPPAARDTETEAFTEMRLSRPILKGIAAMGFVKPTAVQASAIPVAMKGQDICGAAVTGSGKTAAFVIPVLERLLYRPKSTPASRVLILVPTRELGAQCHSVVEELSKFTDIQSVLCVGGLSVKQQEVELRKRPDIVIATPGRLIDHIHNSPQFTLDHIDVLVIDEADRILDAGFKAELTEVIRNCPKGRQTMLFSATMTDNIDDLVALSLNRPVRLFIDESTALTSRLVQEFIRVRGSRGKTAILASLCMRTYKSECIIFFKSKAEAHEMRVIFGLLGLRAAELHGNLTQFERLEALELFRERKVDFLLATDLASRGIDIPGIKTVVNFDMPTNYSLYVHRVGRTARAGLSGRAVSLVQESDRRVLKLAIKNAGPYSSIKNRVIPNSIVEKYESKIKSLEGSIENVKMMDKQESMIKDAEIQVDRATNMIKHSEEIKSRPKKEWFRSAKETAASNKSAPRNHEKGAKRSALDGLSRKKKRRKVLEIEEQKDQLKRRDFASRAAKKASRSEAPIGKSKSAKPKSGKKGRKGKFDKEIR